MVPKNVGDWPQHAGIARVSEEVPKTARFRKVERLLRTPKAQRPLLLTAKLEDRLSFEIMSRLQMCALFLASTLTVSAFAQTKPQNSDIENIGSRDINKGSIDFYSIDKEIAMGRQLSAKYEGAVKLYDNAEVNEYINRLGQNIVHNSDARNIPFTFKVIEATDLDATAFPGGFVYVPTGAIAMVDNEAELAFVLAQQIAHVAARHATEQASKGQLVNAADIPTFPAGRQIPIQFLKEARAQVMEADFLGMQYLYKAGYDPNAAITFLQKIAAAEPKTMTPRLFRPVPPAADRIAAMQENIPLILPSRSQNVSTTPEFARIKALVKI